MDSFDAKVRLHVYKQFVELGRAPTIAEVAAALKRPQADVKEAFRRLGEGKALVLQEGTGELLMAEPFSAVPTAFQVKAAGRWWWANCIWDALGVLAMLRTDGRVVTSCGDCGDALSLNVSDGSLVTVPVVVHYGVPARDWWKNVLFA